ncbi:MAG: protein kinase [Gemmatimonadetes bacterium]|nr:protein kinase [Gemmatimonadota bacterium]NNM06128.1 protein kinase [Gemmatimonadota bacterium]
MEELQQRLTAALSERYTVLRELGRGGMATVYLAEDLKHSRKVAIKVLKPELASALGTERFLREIEISAGLDHPHILPVYDSGEAGGFLYYVMPNVEGESLRDRLDREKQLPLDDALQIAREVADALSYAHSREVVHRDIKPANIMLAGGHARVADFGIARAIRAAGGERLTGTGMSIGTPLYMSPEQAAGSADLDGRSDLYSLGCVLFECLAGKAPFTGSLESVVHQHLAADPPNITTLRPAVPAEVASALMRALAKTPADRFSPAANFAEALRPGPSSTGVVPTPRSTVSPALAAGAFGIAGLLVLGVVYLLVLQIGLPTWVFGAAIGLLLIGFPLVLATAFQEQKRAKDLEQDAEASGFFTWRRTLSGGGLAFGGLAVITTVLAAAGAIGIGPSATLITSGEMEDRERLILADFENRTSESTHGTTVTELMRIGLSQSTAISTMDPLQLARTLQLMRRDGSEGITEEVAMAAAEREGLKGIITGEVSEIGSQLTVSARLVATDGEILLAETELAASPEALVDATDRLSDRMRERFGESLRDIRAGRPLERVTTGSMRAMRVFSQGLEAWNQGDQTRALQLLGEAIAEDSMFAMAHRKTAIILSNEGEQRARAVEAATKAYEYRDRLTERERYLVTAAYHSVVTGNRDLQISAYRNVLDMYPDDTYALNNLGVIYGQLRDFERSSDYYAEALNVDGTNRLYYSNLSGALARQRQWDSATVIAELFQERFPTNPEVKLAFVLNAAYEQQYDSAQVLAQALLDDQRGTVFWEAIAYEWWGHLDALQGQMASARNRWERAFQISTDRGIRGTYLLRMARRVVAERLLLDDPEHASGLLDDALTLHPLEELAPLDRPYTHLAFAYAASGKPSKARDLLAEYEENPEADHAEEAEQWADGARGVIALAEDRPEEALDAFRRFDDGNACATCAYPWLARTFDSMGQQDSVQVMYERFTDLPSADLWYDAGHLAYAYLRLAEIHQGRGEAPEAIQYYTRFLDLWEDADSDFAPWIEAARTARDGLSVEPVGSGVGGS